MRISSTLFFQTGLNSINAQQSDLMHLYQQIGSGQRMVTPADDPLAAAQAINISQAQTMNKRFADNRGVANQNLGIEDNTLQSVNLLLQDLKTQLVSAGNGTLSDADRSTLSNVLSNARNSLLGLVNTTDGSGQYLFSGAKGNTAAYQDVNGKIVYMGDSGQRKIQADQTRQIASSDVGSDIFNRAAPGTTSYLTTAAAGNGGTGVISTPMIMDASGADVGKTFDVTFTAGPDADGKYQYTAIAKDPAGGPDAQYDGFYTPGTTASLNLGNGVQANFSGTPVIGDKFAVEPASSSDYAATGTSATASISSPSVSDYSKVRPGDVYKITFTGPDTYTVDVSNASTDPVYPPLQLTNQKFVPGRENTLDLPFGMQVKISGNPTNPDTFTVKASSVEKTDLNIFDTLDSIINSLKQPHDSDQAKAAFQNTLATAMQRLDVNYNNVLTVRSSVGARMNELDGLNANGAMRSLGYSAQLSKLEDVDYYTASTQLQLRTSALEAAALAFRKIQATSLFNMGK